MTLVGGSDCYTLAASRWALGLGKEGNMGPSFIDYLISSVQSDLSTQRIEMRRLDTDFESWFLHQGGYLHPSVEIASDSAHGNCVRVKPNHVLFPGSIVVSCPHQLTISWPIISQYHCPDSHSPFTPHIATRLFLMKQRLLQVRSRSWPYIHSLPHTFSTPLWYDDNDLVWLRGTNLGNAKVIREEAWRQEYEEAMGSLFPDASKSEDKHLWTWFVICALQVSLIPTVLK